MARPSGRAGVCLPFLSFFLNTVDRIPRIFFLAGRSIRDPDCRERKRKKGSGEALSFQRAGGELTFARTMDDTIRVIIDSPISK